MVSEMTIIDRSVDPPDDAGVFETAADFFSLLSLAIIYMAVMFGLSGGSGELASATRLAAGGSGMTAPFDPTTAYLALVPGRSEMLLRLQTPSGATVLERVLTASAQGESEAVTWALTTLRDDHKVVTVICFLSADEDEAWVHRSFNRLVAKLMEQYEVAIRM